MANYTTFEIWQNATHSEKSNFYKILQAVVNNSYSNAYKIIKSITLNQNTELTSNLYELFRSVTNSNGRDLAGILNDVYDSDLEAFRVKIDETLPFLNANEDDTDYIFLTVDKTANFINVVETDDSNDYYLRISATGQLFCYPKDDLIQALRETSDTQLIDKSSTGDARAVRLGRGYYFNGTDNVVTLDFYQQGGTPFYFESSFIFTGNPSNIGLFQSSYTYTNKGIAIRLTNTYQFSLIIANGSAGQSCTHTATLLTNAINDVIVDWNGLIGGVITITVNGVVETFIATHSWTGNSQQKIKLGKVYTSTTIPFSILTERFTVNNGNEYIFDCEEETGSQCIARNGTIGAIAGTLTGFHVADTRKTYSQANNIGHLTSATGQILPLNSGLAYVNKYEGRVPYNLPFKNASAFDFTASTNYIQLTAGLSIVDYVAETGTTPIINGSNQLTVNVSGWVAYVKLSNGVEIPFVQKLGVATPTVYDVNSDTAYTISGTVTSAKTVAQDSYFYAQTQGYTDDGTNYVPASKLNSGYDVLGNVLTNPSSDKGIDKNTYVQQFLAPALIYASDCSTFFNKTTLSAVTAKIIQGSSIPTNCDNQEFSNQRTTDVTDILIYDVEKTVDEVNKILVCNAKTNTEIVFLIDENDNYLVDEYGYLKIE